MEGKSLKKTTHAHNITEKKKRGIFRESNKNRHADEVSRKLCCVNM